MSPLLVLALVLLPPLVCFSRASELLVASVLLNVDVTVPLGSPVSSRCTSPCSEDQHEILGGQLGLDFPLDASS